MQRLLALLSSQRFFIASAIAFLAALGIARGMVSAGAAGRIAIAVACAMLGIAGVACTILAAKRAFGTGEGERNAALVIMLVAVLAVLNLSAILIGLVTVIEQLAET